MDRDHQLMRLQGKVNPCPVKRRRKSTNKENPLRKCSRIYTLPKDVINHVTVCKEYFLYTLGYKKGHDKILSCLFENIQPSMITSQMDRRGKHAPSHKITDETKALVESHIESFYPAVPHYRRAHAPFRRYLPPPPPHELTIKVMFNHFKEVNPLVKCQERSYRRFLNKMNIVFGKLGDEECENCRAFSLHEHDSKETSNADSERCSVE